MFGHQPVNAGPEPDVLQRVRCRTQMQVAQVQKFHRGPSVMACASKPGRSFG